MAEPTVEVSVAERLKEGFEKRMELVQGSFPKCKHRVTENKKLGCLSSNALHLRDKAIPEEIVVELLREELHQHSI